MKKCRIYIDLQYEIQSKKKELEDLYYAEFLSRGFLLSSIALIYLFFFQFNNQVLFVRIFLCVISTPFVLGGSVILGSLLDHVFVLPIKKIILKRKIKPIKKRIYFLEQSAKKEISFFYKKEIVAFFKKQIYCQDELESFKERYYLFEEAKTYLNGFIKKITKPEVSDLLYQNKDFIDSYILNKKPIEFNNIAINKQQDKKENNTNHSTKNEPDQRKRRDDINKFKSISQPNKSINHNSSKSKQTNLKRESYEDFEKRIRSLVEKESKSHHNKDSETEEQLNHPKKRSNQRDKNDNQQSETNKNQDSPKKSQSISESQNITNKKEPSQTQQKKVNKQTDNSENNTKENSVKSVSEGETSNTESHQKKLDLDTVDQEEKKPEQDNDEKGKESTSIEQLVNDKEEKVKRNTTVGKRRSYTPSAQQIDWEKINQLKSDIGKAGEEIVLQLEKERLHELGWSSDNVTHISAIKGDGAGYDIRSKNENSEPVFIEVKATTSNQHSGLFLSQNELRVMKEKKDNYYLYRVYNLDLETKSFELEVYKGCKEIEDCFDFKVQDYSVKKK